MPAVFWITGLSGTGKTTLGNFLNQELEQKHKKTVFLDGDILRKDIFSLENNLDPHIRSTRLSLAKKYINLCKLLYDQGFIVIISTISLFKEVHSINRKTFKNYCEIFLDIDLNTLKERDPKGLYKKFEDGKIKNITGLDLKADYPENPHFRFNTADSLKGVKWMCKNILKANKFSDDTI